MLQSVDLDPERPYTEIALLPLLFAAAAGLACPACSIRLQHSTAALHYSSFTWTLPRPKHRRWSYTPAAILGALPQRHGRPRNSFPGRGARQSAQTQQLTAPRVSLVVSPSLSLGGNITKKGGIADWKASEYGGEVSFGPVTSHQGFVASHKYGSFLKHRRRDSTAAWLPHGI